MDVDCPPLQNQNPAPAPAPAPATTVALACAACGRLVTPCLVCAHPISCCTSFNWQICHKCKVRNPVGENERRLLGLPPPLALPSAMVRRLLVAHLGRRAYAIATRMQLLKLQQVLETLKTLDQEQDLSASCNHDTSRSIDKRDMQYPSVHLPFVLYEGMSRCSAQKGEGELHHDGFGNALAMQCSRWVPFTRNCYGQTPSTTENCVTVHSERKEKVHDISGSMNGVESPSAKVGRSGSHLPASNKLNQEANIKRCDGCGGDCEASCHTQLQADKIGLLWCQEQLFTLQCPEALSTDLQCSSLLYPICSSTAKSVIKILESRTCIAQVGGDCGSKQFGVLSLGVLRLASAFLRPQLENWLAEKQLQSGESLQYLEDILATADLFLKKKAKVFQSQNAVSRACVAKEQAIQDCTALSQEQLYSSVGSLLKTVLGKIMQERTEKWKKDVEPFFVLLDQINLFLEFCYSQVYIVRSSQPPMLCTVDLQGMVNTEEVVNQKSTLTEALSMVVSSWLLLYHDVAHAVGVL